MFTRRSITTCTACRLDLCHLFFLFSFIFFLFLFIFDFFRLNLQAYFTSYGTFALLVILRFNYWLSSKYFIFFKTPDSTRLVANKKPKECALILLGFLLLFSATTVLAFALTVSIKSAISTQ